MFRPVSSTKKTLYCYMYSLTSIYLSITCIGSGVKSGCDCFSFIDACLKKITESNIMYYSSTIVY